MPALQRSISLRGPRFFADGAAIMFVNHLDGSTRDGPRQATAEDQAAHPAAWASYEADDGRDPLKPTLVAIDPPDGRPEPEEGPHARKRREAAQRAEENA